MQTPLKGYSVSLEMKPHCPQHIFTIVFGGLYWWFVLFFYDKHPLQKRGNFYLPQHVETKRSVMTAQ